MLASSMTMINKAYRFILMVIMCILREQPEKLSIQNYQVNDLLSDIEIIIEYPEV